MNCDNIKQLLISYLNNELESGRPDAIKDHLDTCTDCNSEYQSIVQVQSEFKQMLNANAELASPSPDAWLNIQKRIDPRRNRFAGLIDRLSKALRNFLDTPVWQKRLVGSLSVLTTAAAMVTVLH
jgi:anti-sigma factor RsiW